MSGKRLTIYLVALVIAVAVFLWYRAGNEQKIQSGTPAISESAQPPGGESVENDAEISAAEEAALELEDANFNESCVNGEWEKISQVEGNAVMLTGKLRRVYPDDDVSIDLKSFTFYVEGKENTALSGSDLSKLDNFEDRDVEARGVKSSDGKSVVVSQVKCAGAETDKTVIENRDKLLNWLTANINSVAPSKAPYQKWVILSAAFVDEKNVYVEYYDIAEDSDEVDIDEDTWREVLVEISPKSGSEFESKVLAYWEMEDENEVLRSGNDKFEDAEDITDYAYDIEDNSWTRI